MSMTDSGVLRIMSEKLSYLGKKQAVHAQNVANADTPGYKAKDVLPFTFDEALAQIQPGMTVTSPGHITPASMAGVNAGTKKAKSFETVPSGNSVDLEQQMMEVSQSTVDYQASVSIMHKFMSLLRMSVKGGG